MNENQGEKRGKLLKKGFKTAVITFHNDDLWAAQHRQIISWQCRRRRWAGFCGKLRRQPKKKKKKMKEEKKKLFFRFPFFAARRVIARK